MCYYASWQNFAANIEFPTNLTITARTTSKFCARSRSHVSISLTSTQFPEAFLEIDNLGQNMILYL